MSDPRAPLAPHLDEESADCALVLGLLFSITPSVVPEVLSVGGVASGLTAVGRLAAGALALGGLAFGIQAMRGIAVGPHAFGALTAGSVGTPVRWQRGCGRDRALGQASRSYCPRFFGEMRVGCPLRERAAVSSIQNVLTSTNYETHMAQYDQRQKKEVSCW